MESWDDENFEPKEVAPAGVVPPNKWEGEDEDDEVKDNWEDEDDEQKVEDPKPVIPTKAKKKSAAEKIEEREKAKREEQEKRLKELEENEDISPEERLRLQKESDLQVAMETFGGSNSSIGTGIDAMNPLTKQEFDELADAITSKVQPFSKNSEYPVFAETVVRNICASMSSNDIKKIKNTLDNLYLEKQKIEKGDKAKKSKGKGKAKLKMDNENQFSAYVDDYDEFNDFM